MRGVGLAVVGLASLLSGCGDDGAPGEEREAPPPVAVTLAGFEVGERDGPRAFGLLSDAVWVGEDVVVLDTRPPRLVRLDAAGRVTASAGGEGDGPGELRHPVALDTDGELIVVLDQGRSRVLLWSAADSLAFEGEFRIPFVGFDLCVLGDEILVNGPHEGRSLHVYGMDGELRRSLEVAADLDVGRVGDAWEADILGILRQGKLACTGPDEVLFLPQWSPVVTAIDAASGERRWSVRLEGYEQVRWEGGDGLSFGPDPEVGWVHEGAGVVRLDDGRVLVQLRRYGEAASTSTTSDPQEYRVLSPADSLQRRVSETLPRIVEVRGGRGLALSEEPWPRVVGVELR